MYTIKTESFCVDNHYVVTVIYKYYHTYESMEITCVNVTDLWRHEVDSTYPSTYSPFCSCENPFDLIDNAAHILNQKGVRFKSIAKSLLRQTVRCDAC